MSIKKIGNPKNKKEKNLKTKKPKLSPSERKKRLRLALYPSIVILLALISVIVISKLPQNKKTVINGISLRGELSEEFIMPEANYYYIAPLEEFVFDMQVKYSDTRGKYAFSAPLDKSDVVMIFSDTSICDRTAYNTIRLHDTIEAGTTFTVRTVYKKTEYTYTFFVGINASATIDSNSYVTNLTNITTLVGKNRKVAAAYTPDDLTTPGIKFVETISSTTIDELTGEETTTTTGVSVSTSEKLLREEASTAAERMFTAAKNDGYILIARRCFSHESLHSYEHRLGLAIDITCASSYYSSASFTSTREYRWLMKNAYKYGFVLRYPSDKTSVTRVGGVNNHFRYVGTTLAEYLYFNDLALEEVTIEVLEGK